MGEMPRNLVVAAAVATDGNVSRLADLLGISRRTLQDIKAKNGKGASPATLMMLAMVAARPDDAVEIVAEAERLLAICGIAREK